MAIISNRFKKSEIPKFKKDKILKAILADLQANGNTQGAVAQRGVVCEKQTHHAWLGGTQHGNAAWGRGEGYSLSLSLSR